MDEDTNKYLNRIRGLFISFGILLYLVVFTFGIILFGMDATAKLYQFILMALAPLLYILVGAFIRKPKKFIWISALVLSGLTIMNFPIGTIFGIIFFINLLKPEVKSYYSKSG